MDYEKKYKEAVNKIKNLLDDGEKNGFTIVTYKTDLESIFPELKESEDGRIRKELIFYLRYQHSISEKFKDIGKWIAWLEKQEDCEHIRKDWLEHIKQSWYKEGFIDGKYSGGTSKEWTINDAATLKEIIDFFENGTVKLQHDLSLYASWLKSIRPQNTWKPSDAQMNSITCAVRKMKESACYDSELVSLLNDLKKLKGE